MYKPETIHYYALKLTGYDASGAIHTYTTTAAACSKTEAQDKATDSLRELGIVVTKFHNTASFDTAEGAYWQVQMWNKQLLQS